MDKPTIHKNIEEPVVLKSQLISKLAKMKTNKAIGSDGILIEMLLALDYFRIDKFAKIINEIYDAGETLEDLSCAIFLETSCK